MSQSVICAVVQVSLMVKEKKGVDLPFLLYDDAVSGIHPTSEARQVYSAENRRILHRLLSQRPVDIENNPTCPAATGYTTVGHHAWAHILPRVLGLFNVAEPRST